MNEEKSYVSTICNNPLPNKSLGEILEEFKKNPTTQKWRIIKANRHQIILRKYLKFPISKISVKAINNAFSSLGENDRVGMIGSFNSMLKNISGDKLKKNEIATVETPTKIKHFVVDHAEVEILLKQRNSRFSEILKEIRAQLAILPEGKDHGFYPGTTDPKEIQSMVHAINPSVNELGFVTRYIKSEKAIFIIRKESIKKGENKNGK